MALTKNAKTWMWVGGILLALVIYNRWLVWWSNIPPKRPASVSSGAVFLFGLPIGAPYPVPKRGDWLNCGLDLKENVDRCRTWDVDGSLEYEGAFVRSEGSGPVPEDDLQIDVKATNNRPEWVYFNEKHVPIVHLHDGTILIPAEAYEAGKQRLEWVREYQRR